MTAPSRPDFLTGFAEGFAVLLADAGIGFAWEPSGAYDGTAVGIYMANVPATPDKIMTITPQPMDTDPVFTDAAVNFQLRFRAGQDPRDVWAMRDACRTVLRGRFPTRLPTGVYVSQLTFANGTSMGLDVNKRWEWADNYRTRATELPTS